ncbi:hypothetical protein ABIA54_004892 [Pseudomonas sp. EB276 TE3739]|jgi:hypothetical protein|nr:hypothetical protein [Pseudomonas koreensis]
MSEIQQKTSKGAVESSVLANNRLRAGQVDFSMEQSE